ncbi:MAG: RES family NAD+ phosphorylase [Opitutales bacterium]|nr:RES family NAD+ phosphorylase [Opitutales bacterium]
MVSSWRIVAEARANAPWDGLGARRYGGRWNPVGLAAVYSAGSRALAALEILAHLPRPTPPMVFCLFEVKIPEDAVVDVTDARVLASVESPEIEQLTQNFGAAWLRAQTSVALRVPSALVPEEPNYVLNPEHRDFAHLVFGDRKNFAFDRRLLR